MKKLNMILAIDDKNWLWKNWDLAWKISTDMKYFKNITTTTNDLAKLNAVIMWKNTRDSISTKFRPLPNRINCILSRSLKFESTDSKIDDYVIYFNSIYSCVEALSKKENLENIFIIGWANIYNQFLDNKKLDKIYITRVIWDYWCDVFFKWIPKKINLLQRFY
jgi:dihydrofolate reductase